MFAEDYTRLENGSFIRSQQYPDDHRWFVCDENMNLQFVILYADYYARLIPCSFDMPHSCEESTPLIVAYETWCQMVWHLSAETDACEEWKRKGEYDAAVRASEALRAILLFSGHLDKVENEDSEHMP